MSVHPDGTGTGWTNVEAVDVDQPHGKDYLYSQHIAKGVRKRMNQEHSAFADATVGGVHKPGGAAVLGECDGTPGAADGTYRGHGVVWDMSSRLWCSTAAAGASTSGDFTVITLHPDLQWKGGDVTWAGAHEFDASVDISGNVALDGDFSVDGTAAFTDASFDGTVDFGGVVAFGSDVSIDGTLAIQDTVLTGDSTLTFDAIAGETGPTFAILGDWSTRGQDATYTARTDGYVSTYGDADGDRSVIIETPAGTPRKKQKNATADGKASISCFVRNGDTWCVRGDPTTGTYNVFWLPFGDNT